MKTNRDDLIVKMTRAREQLNATLERLSPQVEIYPAWKLKQLLDHITGWDELVAAAFRTHSQSDIPMAKVVSGINQFNASSVEDRKALSLEESRKAYDTARSAVLQAMREMPDDKLDQQFKAPWGGKCSVNSVVIIFVSHELEHAKKLDDILKGAD